MDNIHIRTRHPRPQLNPGMTLRITISFIWTSKLALGIYDNLLGIFTLNNSPHTFDPKYAVYGKLWRLEHPNESPLARSFGHMTKNDPPKP